MKSKCCGQYLAPNSDNKFYFRKKCLVCKKIYKQRKRQKKSEVKTSGT